MDTYDYKEVMQDFYTSMSRYVSEKPEIIAELEAQEAYFSGLGMEEHEKKMIVFDWYIFDYKSEALSKNLLQYFLDNAGLDKETRNIYTAFKNCIYSIFI